MAFLLALLYEKVYVESLLARRHRPYLFIVFNTCLGAWSAFLFPL